MSTSLFICKRSSDRPGCKTPGCSNDAATACTFELRGRAEGKKCSRALCADCSGSNKLCPPHQRLGTRRPPFV